MQHEHYFLNVAEHDVVDLYDICYKAEIHDPSGCIHHALKKLLFAGKRGVKGKRQDIIEAHETLTRWLEITADERG